MKGAIFFCLVVIFAVATADSAHRFGADGIGNEVISIPANTHYAQRFVLVEPTYVTKLGYVSRDASVSSSDQVKMGLFTDGGDAPGLLLFETGWQTNNGVTAGNEWTNTLENSGRTVRLEPGVYWMSFRTHNSANGNSYDIQASRQVSTIYQYSLSYNTATAFEHPESGFDQSYPFTAHFFLEGYPAGAPDRVI